VLTCRDVVRDPWVISDALSEALDELVTAAALRQQEPAGA
jgi:hypothetical protein